MKSADKPAATENTVDSTIFKVHPQPTRIPTVTDMMKRMVITLKKLRITFCEVARITKNATAIAIPYDALDIE